MLTSVVIPDAYNMGDDGDARGDSYMNAFSTAAIASCPFIPVIGNHESTQCPGDEVDESTHERCVCAPNSHRVGARELQFSQSG